MLIKFRRLVLWALAANCIFFLSGCSLFSKAGQETLQSPTATPTEVGGVLVPDNSPQHPCEGVSGTLELQILVGPAEAVGLLPVTVGHIPFSVVGDGEPYRVEGGGSLDYYEEMLELEKGSYTVTFNGETKVSGDCVSRDNGGMLNLIVEMTGEQMVEVNVEGFQNQYPWSGTNDLSVNLPLESGAMQEGEGWVLILHLN